MGINTRSRKVREEIWIGLGVASILSIGVLAFSAQRAQEGTEYVIRGGMVADEKKEAITGARAQTGGTQPPASAPRETHVYATLSELSGASGFANLLAETGVSTMLASGGSFSVFVPTNQALALADTSSMTAAEKERFVQYHIIRDRSVDISALRSGSVYAASGDQLNFVVVGDEKLERVNSSRIIGTRAAGNGVIYLIDAPLFPPARSR